MSDSSNVDLERDPTLQIPVGTETVAATRYQPLDDADTHPVLLMYIPYRKDDFITFGAYQPLVEYLAQHGYEVVVADIVGTGASTGCMDDPLDPEEGEQAAQIIEWLGDREWSTGQVGMFGKSYGGLTSLRGAVEQPDVLEAIVPIHAPYTGYRDTYVGGSFALYGMGGHWTPLMQALQAAPPSRRDQEGRWASIWHDRLDELEEQRPWLFRYLEHDHEDEYWQGRQIPVEQITVPTLAISGWRDSYPHTTIEYFERIDAPKHLLLGPWRHTMPHRGRESAIDFRRLVRQWFDAHIKGDDVDCLDDGDITYWTETDGGGEPECGSWRRQSTWPTTTVDETTEDDLSFHLSESGLTAPDDSWDGFETTHECDYTVGMDSFDAGLPADTTADDVRSVVFETDTLSTPIELTGSGEASLRVAATSADPLLSVRVVDVAPDGTATLVTHGQLRLTHRNGHDTPAEVEPEKEYRVSVPLRPKSHVFDSGHMIRVAVSGSFFPSMLPPSDQDELTLRSTPASPSTISFPGQRHENTPSFDDIEFGDPVSTPAPEPAAVLESNSMWTNSRDHLSDTGTVETSTSQVVELPHATMRYREEIEADVVADDPATAGVKRTSEIYFEYDTETVRVNATSHASRDTARAHTTVSIDDQTVFDKTWRQG